MELIKGVEWTYAPTSFLVTIKVYLTFVAVYDWEMVKIDFTNAFINAPTSDNPGPFTLVKVRVQPAVWH